MPQIQMNEKLEKTKLIAKILVPFLLGLFLIGGILFIVQKNKDREATITYEKEGDKTKVTANLKPAIPATQIKNITVEYFKSDKEEYKKDEKVIIDFKIKNTLKMPYKVTVSYFSPGNVVTPLWSWYNLSTEEYTTNEEANKWYSFYPDQKINGHWLVRLCIKYQVDNKECDIENSVYFNVI